MIRAFLSFCESLSDTIYVIDPSVGSDDYVIFNLSKTNPELLGVDLSNPFEVQSYIDKVITEGKGKVAFGGYLEVRDIYKRSCYFSSANSDDERIIHIGMDIWAEKGTEVLAALDGTVHSFANNQNDGDYGPTIILEHEIGEVKFYTLYGHLTASSLANLEIGQFFEKGSKISEMGGTNENGGYAPHVHFQVIIDIDKYVGDYPGVCSRNTFEFYLENCPDPNLLLKLY